MSHFSQIRAQFKNRESILDSLKGLGFSPIEHETAVNLRGYKGDKRKQTAEIVVTRQNIGGASNDLGFKWQEDTKEYLMYLSEYDQACGYCAPSQGLGPTFLPKFTQGYIAAEVVRNGEYVVQGQEVMPNGDIRMVVTKKQVVTIGAGTSAPTSEFGGADFSSYVV